MKNDVIERERRMKEELEEARQLKRDAEEMRIEAEEFLERQRRAEKAEAKMEGSFSWGYCRKEPHENAEDNFKFSIISIITCATLIARIPRSFHRKKN